MYQKKLVALAVLGATITLTGCGEKSISVQVEPTMLKQFESHGVKFTDGKLYQITDETVAKIKKVTEDSRYALDMIRKQGGIDADAIAANPYKDAIEKSRLASEAKSATLESEWQAHEVEVKAKYADDIAKANIGIMAAQKAMEKFESYYAKELKQRADAIAKRDSAGAVMDSMTKQYTDFINDDIITMKKPYPVIKGQLSFDYRPHNFPDRCTPDKSSLETTAVATKGRCYLLRTYRLDKDMGINSPHHAEVAKLFDQYIIAMERQKQGAKEINLADGAIRKAQIIAENQTGTNHRQLERQLQSAEGHLNSINSKIDNQLSRYKKTAFIADALLAVHRPFEQEVNKKAGEQYNALFANARHVEKLKMGDAIQVDAKMPHAVLVYEWKMDDKVASSMVGFNVTTVLKQEKPTIEVNVRGRNVEFVEETVNIDNNQLRRMIVDHTS